MKKMIFALTALLLVLSYVARADEEVPEYFKPTFTNSDVMMTLVLRPGKMLLNGLEFGVYSEMDSLIGAGIVIEGTCGITVYGDNVKTSVIDGAHNDESLHLRCYNKYRKQLDTVYLTDVYGMRTDDSLYYPSGLMFITDGYIKATIFVPMLGVEEESSNLPKLNVVRVGSSDKYVAIGDENRENFVKFEVFDAVGNRVYSIAGDQAYAVSDGIELDMSGYSNGVYFAVLTGRNGSGTSKFVVNR